LSYHVADCPFENNHLGNLIKVLIESYSKMRHHHLANL
jgi:hypothetical protein